MEKNIVNHIYHIEELPIVNAGCHGWQDAVTHIRACAMNALMVNTTEHSISIKWDGSPSVLINRDWVATKSVFNVTPKFYKDFDEVDADESLPKRVALVLLNLLSIRHLLQIPNNATIQCDLMFCKQAEDYDLPVIKANLIEYDFRTHLDFSKINSAVIGLAPHTLYYGEPGKLEAQPRHTVNLESTHPGIYIFPQRNKWIETPRNAHQHILEPLNDFLSYVDEYRLYQCVNYNWLKFLMLPKSRELYLKFMNTLIRENRQEYKHEDFVEFINAYFDKEIAKKKKQSTIQEWESWKRTYINLLNYAKDGYEQHLKATELLVNVKMSILHVLDQYDTSIKSIRDEQQFTHPVGHEGYVSLYRDLNVERVKLVNRAVFSHHNFRKHNG